MKQTLTALLGDAAVYPIAELGDRAPHLRPYLPEHALLVTPPTPEAGAEVIACAQRQGWRVLPIGAGTKLNWLGNIPQADILLQTTAWHRLIDHAAADMTVTTQVGIPLQRLQQQLATARQWIAADPLFAERATLGGCLATCSNGTLRQRYGSWRDQLLGVKFIRSDGQIVKAGGRVVKNVAGYDLMKLLIGSYGTLGILTEVTLRVYPLPDAVQIWQLRGEVSALASGLAAILTSALAPARCVLRLEGTGALLLELEFHTLREVLAAGTLGDRLSHIAQTHDLQLEAAAPLGITLNPTPNQVILKIGVPLQEMLPALTQLQQLARKLACECRGEMSAGVGYAYLHGQEKDLRQLILRLRQGLPRGYVTVLAAPLSLKQQLDPWDYRGNALELMRSLKQQLDATGVFGTGVFVGHL
ncbi:glycolate oxidase subunit FAD binding subunit GlcE [Thermosynechococcus sp. NK55a]|uniref:FAD-binding oxidoreductase n=1 Tax=Thermosynechococcus sp. NK55a TaxID=1394889 RepID=UPI0003D87977|nr:FAD-binding oxidoreductase [Thermosynechococcus sp. NK55a]AHB88311.1 glycolate oxidase subunit FAD binding subunit GlcE [Thermosynechococcus sp. NK55a]